MSLTKPDDVLTPIQVVLAKRIEDGVRAGVLVDNPDLRDEQVLHQLAMERMHNLPPAQNSLVLTYLLIRDVAKPGTPARATLEKGLAMEREITLKQIIAAQWPARKQ